MSNKFDSVKMVIELSCLTNDIEAFREAFDEYAFDFYDIIFEDPLVVDPVMSVSPPIIFDEDEQVV